MKASLYAILILAACEIFILVSAYMGWGMGPKPDHCRVTIQRWAAYWYPQGRVEFAGGQKLHVIDRWKRAGAALIEWSPPEWGDDKPLRAVVSWDEIQYFTDEVKEP